MHNRLVQRPQSQSSPPDVWVAQRRQWSKRCLALPPSPRRNQRVRLAPTIARVAKRNNKRLLAIIYRITNLAACEPRGPQLTAKTASQQRVPLTAEAISSAHTEQWPALSGGAGSTAEAPQSSSTTGIANRKQSRAGQAEPAEVPGSGGERNLAALASSGGAEQERRAGHRREGVPSPAVGAGGWR